MSDKTAVIGTFCLLGCLLHSAWTETKLNHRHTEECWHVTRRCRERGHRADRKSQGKRTERGPRVLSSAVAFSGPSEPPSVPGLGRPGQETSSPDSMLPPYAAGACTRTNWHGWEWHGMVWSGPHQAELTLSLQDRKRRWGKEHLAALSMLVRRTSREYDEIFTVTAPTGQRFKVCCMGADS